MVHPERAAEIDRQRGDEKDQQQKEKTSLEEQQIKKYMDSDMIPIIEKWTLKKLPIIMDARNAL